MKRLDVSTLGFDGLIQREWLATNGLGGYASSTIPGTNTRKYHGLLVAAMTPPVRRMVLLSRVEEMVIADGCAFPLAANEYPGVVHPRGHEFLRAFSHEPFPRWAYQGNGWTIEKQLRLLRGQNTVVLSYTLLGGGQDLEMELRPLLALRPIHQLMYQWQGRVMVEKRGRRHHHVPATGRTPEVFVAHDGAFGESPTWYFNTIYRREQERGYAGLEDLWAPGIVRYTLRPGKEVHFVCSTDPIDFERAIQQADSQYEDAAAQLVFDSGSDSPIPAMVRAVDQYILTSPADPRASRPAPAVLTQYPWSAPNVRDALIAFTGLYLVPGKLEEGLALLSFLAAHVKQGLVPSHYPEDGSEPRYESADASLWFVNAVHDLLRYGAEPQQCVLLVDATLHILDQYGRGTSLGIQTDADGLIGTHQPGVATTWTDAKLGECVVNPRQGRPVELNALWYNALCIGASFASRVGRRDLESRLTSLSQRVRKAFNERFWNESTGCCFDVLDENGNDASVRPNQLLAISLPHAVLAPDRQAAVLAKVRGELLTPMAVRSLSPNDPDYRGHYRGDAHSRDRAQHNGSAYPWLLGHYVSAMMRVEGRTDQTRQQAAAVLQGCIDHLQGDGVGQLPELFDGDAPHTVGGGMASATSVGEILRAFVEEVIGRSPTSTRKSPEPTRNTPGPTLNRR